MYFYLFFIQIYFTKLIFSIKNYQVILKLNILGSFLYLFSLNSLIISSNCSTQKSISSFVFSSPIVILKDPCDISFSNPIAKSTCDGFEEPELHALPVDAHIPLSSNFNKSSSPLTFSKDIFAFPGSL